MPADHFGIQVPFAKLESVVQFLISSMEHLGFKELFRPVPEVVGMGEEGLPYFWVTGIDTKGLDEKTMNFLLGQPHIAFSAQNCEQVDQFHTAALKAGGIDNGAAGLRPEYHPGYYGAFVRDPECGINFEVVCHSGKDRSS